MESIFDCRPAVHALSPVCYVCAEYFQYEIDVRQKNPGNHDRSVIESLQERYIYAAQDRFSLDFVRKFLIRTIRNNEKIVSI